MKKILIAAVLPIFCWGAKAQTPDYSATNGIVITSPQESTASDPGTAQGSSNASKYNITAEVNSLMLDLAHYVPKYLSPSSDEAQAWISRVAKQTQAAGWQATRPQILVTVDRNPKVQILYFVLAQPNNSWMVLGGTHVSTGKPGRREHFKTPKGVFQNNSSILGYRAQGTYNENGIRGLGVKGMRVWDFGWQTTENWRVQGATAQIRLEMHSTDPANLEHRIGRPDSEGCVRIPAALNKFIDHYGIIDAQYEQAAQTDRRFEALLPKDRETSLLAGDTLVVFDSSEN